MIVEGLIAIQNGENPTSSSRSSRHSCRATAKPKRKSSPHGQTEKHEKEPNHERWLVSYADFITLLFAVFVTLYAMGQADKKKVEQVVQSLRESFGFSTTGAASQPPCSTPPTCGSCRRSSPTWPPRGEPRAAASPRQGREGPRRGKDYRAIKAALEAYFVKQGALDKISVGITRRGLVVSLKEAGFFDSGSAIVRQSAYPLLAKVAESLAGYTNGIRVEGHTDTVPISSALFPSNWELSTGGPPTSSTS